MDIYPSFKGKKILPRVDAIFSPYFSSTSTHWTGESDCSRRFLCVCGWTGLTFFFSTDRLRPDHLLRRFPLNHRTFGEGPFDLDNVLLRTSRMASTCCAPGLLGAARTTLPLRYGKSTQIFSPILTLCQARVRSPSARTSRPFLPSLTVRKITSSPPMAESQWWKYRPPVGRKG